MRNRGWQCGIGVILAVSLFAAPVVGHAAELEFRTPGISGDTSSDGAVITVALFATVCVVLVLLGLKADYENVFTRADAGTPPADVREPDPAVVREIAQRFDPVRMSFSEQESRASANVSVAWQVRF